MKGSDWESGKNMGQDRKGQKDTNNWGKEEKKIETTDSIGSRVHSFFPISTCDPSQAPLTQDPAFLQSSLNLRISSYHSKVPLLQNLPFPADPPIQEI